MTRPPPDTTLPDDPLGRVQERTRERCLFRLAGRVEDCIAFAEDVVQARAGLDHLGLGYRFKTATLDLLYWSVARSFRLRPDDWRQYSLDRPAFNFERDLEQAWLHFFGRFAHELLRDPRGVRAFVRIALSDPAQLRDDDLFDLLQSANRVLAALNAPSPWTGNSWPWTPPEV